MKSESVQKEDLLQSRDFFITIRVVLFLIGVGYFLRLLAKHRKRIERHSYFENRRAKMPRLFASTGNAPILLDWTGRAPLEVKLVEEVKPVEKGQLWSSWLFLPVVLFAAIALLLQLRYLKLRTDLTKIPGSELRLGLAYPLYFSLSEETAIHVTVLNDGNQYLKDVESIVEIVPQDGPYLAIVQNTNTLKFAGLAPGERKTRKLVFIAEGFRPFRLPVEGKATFNVRVLADGQQMDCGVFKMALAPVPRLKSLLQFLYMSAFLWGIIALFFRGPPSLSKLLGPPLLAILYDLLLEIVVELGAYNILRIMGTQ